MEPFANDGKLEKRVVKAAADDAVAVVPDSLVTVHYSGYLLPSRTLFDSSYARKRPFQFRIGKGEVIRGWEDGILTMKVGEHSELICSHEYGYGKMGNPPSIPPFSSLLFEIEIVKVDLASVREKIAAARNFKDEGNELFKMCSFAAASAIYRKGVEKLSYTWGADPTEAAEAVHLKLALNSNLAASLLKTGDLREAAEAAERAVGIDPKHVKSLFRLAMANAGLARWQDARSAIESAIKLDPNDNSLKQFLLQLDSDIKKAESEEKDLYKKMFMK